MVYKEDVYEWFTKLGPPMRIDVMCALINMCNPLELRYVATCVENLAKRDFIYLRDAEIQSNNVENVAKLTNLDDDVVRSKMIVTLALLHSCQATCSHAIFKTLTTFEIAKKLENEPQDVKFIREFYLLLTMASHHPVFSIDQKTVLQSQLSQLLQIAKDSLAMEDLSEETEEDWYHSCLNTPIRIFYSQNQIYVRDLELLGMQWKKAYRISVTWNNGEITQVLKSHQEMHEFHRKLLQLTFGEFRPSDSSWPASIPYLPEINFTSIKPSLEITEEMLPSMAVYLSQLVPFVSSNLVSCNFAASFFGGQSPEMLSSQNFCSDKSSLQVPSRQSPKEMSTSSSTPITRQTPPLETSPVNSAPSLSVAFTAHPVPGSANNATATSPFATMSSPKMSTSAVVSGAASNVPVSSPVANNKTKPPMGLPQPNVNPNVPVIVSGIGTSSMDNTVTCHRAGLDCTCSRSSSSSSNSSPSASVTSSRSTSPRSKLSVTNSRQPSSELLRNSTEQLAAEEFKKERMKKYCDLLKSYTVQELKSMNDNELKALNVKQGAINKLRKVLEAFPDVPNGITLPNKPPALLKNDIKTRYSNPSAHPSSNQPPVISHSNAKAVTTVENNSQLPPNPSTGQAKQSVCPASDERNSPAMPSAHGVDPDVALMRSSLSILQAPHIAAVPKCLPNNVVRNQPYHVSVSKPQCSMPLGNHDSSSSSEYSSSPPSPRSDNVFLNNVPDVKVASDLLDGAGIKASQYMPPVPNVSRKCSPNYVMNIAGIHTEPNITPPPTSCTPMMSVQHPGMPMDIPQMPPPARPCIRPVMTVPNLMYKTMPPSICMHPMQATPRTQNAGTIIFENSNPASGQNLPSALPMHPNVEPNQGNSIAAQYPVRGQQPFTPDSFVIKPKEGVDPKPGSLPPSSFHSSNPPPTACTTYVSATSRNPKVKSVHSAIPQHNSKFNKSAPSPNSRENNDAHFIQPTTVMTSKCSSYNVPCSSPMVHTNVVSCHNSMCSCNSSKSSPPPPQQTNPTTAITFMPGLMPQVFYQLTPPRGFMPPASAGNGSVSQNMPAGFGFLGNPNQLSNGLTMPEQLRFHCPGSYPAVPHLHGQPNPSNSHLVAGHPNFVNHPPNYMLPATTAPGKPVSCYNCGSIGHQGSACKEATMEEMTKNGQFRLSYVPSQKDGDSPSDLKS